MKDSATDRAMSRLRITTAEDVHRLRDGIASTLLEAPGVTAVTVFGSSADSRCDQFSDIDIRATTIDVGLTCSKLHAALSTIDAIELEWPIASEPENWAATIVFEHLSPLQKLDLSIGPPSVDPSDSNRNQANMTPDSDGHTGISSSVYRPMMGSLEHEVISQLLGTTRYVKARRRGHVLSCWRFASALVDAVIATAYSGIVDDGWMLAGLTSQHYRDADLRMDPLRRSLLISELDFSNPETMDKTVVGLVGKLIVNYQALEMPPAIPNRLLRRLSACTMELLERTQIQK